MTVTVLLLNLPRWAVGCVLSLPPIGLDVPLRPRCLLCQVPSVLVKGDCFITHNLCWGKIWNQLRALCYRLYLY